MSDHTAAPLPVPEPRDNGTPRNGTPQDDITEGSGSRSNKGVWIRAFIYVIGFHIFAGFIMLLFYVGSHRH